MYVDKKNRVAIYGKQLQNMSWTGTKARNTLANVVGRQYWPVCCGLKCITVSTTEESVQFVVNSVMRSLLPTRLSTCLFIV